MKIRNGFVSNSSSSSFLIYGICIENNQEELNKLLGIEPKEDDSSHCECDGECECDEEDDCDVYEFIESKVEEAKLNKEVERHMPYDDQIYVGVCPSNIKDDETGKQFKERVLGYLKKMGFKVKAKDLAYYEEAWE